MSGLKSMSCVGAVARSFVIPLFLAMPIGIASAQDSSHQESSQPAPGTTPAKDATIKLKAAGRLKASQAKPKPRAPAPVQRVTPAPAVSALSANELAKRSSAEMESLIAAQRRMTGNAATSEMARRNLGLISIAAANRILAAEALGRGGEAATYTAMIKASLADTLWRVTQLVREEPARAQAALGLFHANGILVTADPAKSCDFFAKSATAGQTDAAFRAAQCVEKTQPELAQQWLEQAAIGGNPAAEEKMGRACIEGAKLDAECAKRWLQSAAAQGRVSATSVLAWLYVREGTPESLSLASNLYRTAAEAGDFAAQNNLGEFYETGRGTAKDPVQALGWYRRSAAGGFAPGQFNLARLLAYGLGTERDTAAARDWASKAQAQGITQATELLKLIADAEASAK